MPRMDRLSAYHTTVAQQDGKTVITYHTTPIVSYDAATVTLCSGGWDTVTTRRKMNQAASQFGLNYSVFRHKGETMVRQLDRNAVPFIDGMQLNRL